MTAPKVTKLISKLKPRPLILIGLFGIPLLLIISFFALNSYIRDRNQKSEYEIKRIENSIDTSTWHTYEDANNFGISFKYPDGMEITDPKIKVYGQKEGYSSTTTVDEYVSKRYGLDAETKKEVVIDGERGVEVITNDPLHGFKIVDVYFEHEGKLYYLDLGVIPYYDMPEAQASISKILSTFQFRK